MFEYEAPFTLRMHFSRGKKGSEEGGLFLGMDSNKDKYQQELLWVEDASCC